MRALGSHYHITGKHYINDPFVCLNRLIYQPLKDTEETRDLEYAWKFNAVAPLDRQSNHNTNENSVW